MDNIKWMTELGKYCYICHQKRKHYFGIRYVDGKEETVQKCNGCGIITAEPR